MVKSSFSFAELCACRQFVLRPSGQGAEMGQQEQRLGCKVQNSGCGGEPYEASVFPSAKWSPGRHRSTRLYQLYSVGLLEAGLRAGTGKLSTGNG